MRGEIEIAGRRVGDGAHVFIMAEAGCNHNGDVALAKQLVDIAVKAGADAVKFQAFRAEHLATVNAPKADYALRVTDPKESQLQMQRKLELSPDHYRELAAYCRMKGIVFLCSVFDLESSDLMASIGVEAYKIPSGEVTNHPLLRYVAEKKKPMILSTGMSYLGEIEQALEVIRSVSKEDVALLHCTSDYPARSNEANLRALHTMSSAFGIPVGYSDHTPGLEVSIAAVAMGASIIEKHFTVDKTMPGPDHRASLDPEELRELVRRIRSVERALGDGLKRPMPGEENTRKTVRKSLVSLRGISQGTVLTGEMLTVKRPGTGILPASLPLVVGRTAKRDIAEDEIITWDMLK